VRWDPRRQETIYESSEAVMPPEDRSTSFPILMTIAVSVSLCLIILTAGAVYLVAHGNDIGSVDKLSTLGKGSGVVGLAAVLYGIVTVVVRAVRRQTDENKNKSWKKRLSPLVVSAVAAFASAFIANNTHDLAKEKIALTKQVAILNDQVTALKNNVVELQGRREDLLAFLKMVSARENISFIDQRVSDTTWQRVVAELEGLPAGQRKSTVMDAVLLAWREVPFKLTGPTMGEGVNSPLLIIRVLKLNGLQVEQHPGESESAALRRASDEVTSPMPGDLMFFKGSEPGSVGEYVMMYLGPSGDSVNWVCLGLMGKKYPMGIYNVNWLIQPPDPDKPAGIFRPRYKN
jgi:hypothetical protein